MGSVGLTGVPAVEVVLSIKKIITLQCVTLFLCFPQARAENLFFPLVFGNNLAFLQKVHLLKKKV